MSYDILSGEFIDDGLDVNTLLGAYDIVGAAPQQGLIPRAALAQYQGGGGFAPRPAPGYGGQLAQALQSRNLFQQAAAQRLANSGALLRNMNPTKARKQVLGLVSNGTIANGGTATITARPQTFAFKPERIVIPATVGPGFTIQDIKVGNVSQLVQSGDLPAEAFSQTAFGVEMDMDTVQTSQDFIIQVTNISGGAATFRAMVLGRSANG